MNVSSIVIRALPEHIEAVIAEIEKIDGVDYHFKDDRGIIIATIEVENVSDEVRILALIEKTEFVASASMNYAYAEEELEAEKEMIAAQMGKVPEVLNNKVKADKIRYNGSVAYAIPKHKK
ncbi:hypothetical protein FACS189487_07560 [Campylobacterota bacterium]|nr:hypothetical protein FACS189487_07560 [Campylobacterota bacterium]